MENCHTCHQWLFILLNLCMTMTVSLIGAHLDGSTVANHKVCLFSHQLLTSVIELGLISQNSLNKFDLKCLSF